MTGIRPILAAALLVMVAGTVAVRGADDPPADLRGVWSGEGPTRLTVTEQLGTALDGLLLADGHERPIYGVIQRDRKEIMFINPEGDRRGELRAPDEMSFCLEARDDFVFDGPCVLLRREPPPASSTGGA